MKSLKSVKGRLAILPTLEERSVADTQSRSGGSASPPPLSSSSEEEEVGGAQDGNYPADLLGVSWGSYLNNSGRASGEFYHHHRHHNHGLLRRSEALQSLADDDDDEDEDGPTTPHASSCQPAAALPNVGSPALEGSESHPSESKKRKKDKKNKVPVQQGPEGASSSDQDEPHPLLQHLEGLMTELARSKQELSKCGLNTMPLTNLLSTTLSSHQDLKQIVKALAKVGASCNNAMITSDLVHNLVEYLREVLQGLVAQGKKLSVQVAFLQHTAKSLAGKQQEIAKEERRCREDMDGARAKLELERVSDGRGREARQKGRGGGFIYSI